jgi:hypothetical protein
VSGGCVTCRRNASHLHIEEREVGTIARRMAREETPARRAALERALKAREDARRISAEHLAVCEVGP